MSYDQPLNPITFCTWLCAIRTVGAICYTSPSTHVHTTAGKIPKFCKETYSQHADFIKAYTLENLRIAFQIHVRNMYGKDVTKCATIHLVTE